MVTAPVVVLVHLVIYFWNIGLHPSDTGLYLSKMIPHSFGRQVSIMGQSIHTFKEIATSGFLEIFTVTFHFVLTVSGCVFSKRCFTREGNV